MSLYFQDSALTIYHGDALEVLRTLPDESVNCCVTSPPYWGLRDYGVTGQLGLEKTPEEYVSKVVEIFREVRRVTRGDGTLWLNLGDSYASNGPGSWGSSDKSTLTTGSKKGAWAPGKTVGKTPSRNCPDLKPKDLVGIPWMVAFALRADGWYLRQDIIWHKPNPMPESVKDRCTKAHDYIFLLAKGQWKSRVVALSDLHCERVHLGQNFGLESPDSGAITISIGLASSILNCPEFQQDFGLTVFDPQIWKQRLSGVSSDNICCLPIKHSAAQIATRLLLSDCAPKEFLCEIYRLGVTLADNKNFLVGGIDTKFPLPPSINAYGKTAIAIHDSGKICQFDFLHGTIIYQSPSGCKYFYDAGAVKEPQAECTTERYKSGWNGVDDDGSNGARTGSAYKKMKAGMTMGEAMGGNGMRNKRSIWTVPTTPYSGAHFATFPPDLIIPCIKAGCPEGGTVLDPFAGTGVTGMVSERFGRKAVMIDLNDEYFPLMMQRNRQRNLFMAGDQEGSEMREYGREG